MNSDLRMPTLFGLSILVAGIVLGVFLVSRNQNINIQARVNELPQDVNVANLTSDSAAIYWHTILLTTGSIKIHQAAAPEQLFLDERDNKTPLAHKIHFVTLTQLKPNTTYYYKIISGTLIFPSSNWLSFTTTPIPAASYPSIVGTVLDHNLQPAEEGLVTLEIPGSQNIATITKVAGNFILPLKELKNTDLTSAFNLPSSGLPAKLVATDYQINTSAEFTLSPSSFILGPIILGENLELSTPSLTPAPAQ